MSCEDKICLGDSGNVLNFLIEDLEGNYLTGVTAAKLLARGGDDPVELELTCVCDNTEDVTVHYITTGSEGFVIGDYKLRIQYTIGATGTRTTIDYGELEVVDI